MRAQKRNSKNNKITENNSATENNVVGPLVQANDSIVTGQIIWKLTTKQIHNIEEVPRNNKHFISNSCPTSPAHRIVIPQKLATHEEQLVNKDLRNSDIMTTENKRIILKNPDNLEKC